MFDPDLPLTVGEYEEWGNPEDATAYAYMRSYSPYDNVMPGRHPALLVTAGLNDPARRLLGAGEVGRPAPRGRRR